MHSSYAIVQTVWPILWPYRNQLLLPLVGMQSLITFFVLSWEFIQLHKMVPIYSISSAFFCHFSLSVASSKLLILFQFRLDFIIAPICKFHKRSMRQLCTKFMNQKLQQHNWDATFFSYLSIDVLVSKFLAITFYQHWFDYVQLCIVQY